MINIVIPMAGRGSRFKEKGFKDPKPLININGKEMIHLVIENLTPESEHRFIFLCLDEHIEKYGLNEKLREWTNNPIIIPVKEVTEGAACTVLLARNYINNSEQLMIANSDQWLNFNINDYIKKIDNINTQGMIMTMNDNDPKWSYLKFNENNEIIEIVEKKVVSNEATVGIYNFSKGSDFIKSAEKMIDSNDRVNGEFYVAPTYNYLINDGKFVDFHNVGKIEKDIFGLGTPEDLDVFFNFINTNL